MQVTWEFKRNNILLPITINIAFDLYKDSIFSKPENAQKMDCINL